MNPLGRRLFTFAVIADTHVNQEEGKASSDFAVNRLSNARNRHVIAALNRERPAFVLHLGDIVHPTPRHPAYTEAAQAFHALARELQCPLYLTPGNHDVGDKPGDWLPVPSVSEDYLALYQEHFGTDYFCFESNGCHFVVINAQLLNSGLPGEAGQRLWLEAHLADLAAHAGNRIFLATHYPAFLYDPEEEGHYDNIDEPARTWLLALLARHGVEAVFAGHVHNFWYHRLAQTEFYLLPSTAFVRMDYSEMYRIEPGPERGRNDAPKLGYLLVDVHEHGHVAHPVRTDGATLAPGGVLPAGERLAPVHSRSIECSPLGIDLRQPWAEVTEVTASGALDEFARKPARNDYPLMALWEMGVRHLRVPIHDLAVPETLRRMRVLCQSGNQFTVYSHNIPAAATLERLIRHADLVSAWEIIAPLAEVGALAAKVVVLRRTLPFPVRLSKLRRPEDALHHGDRARHVIEHGFYTTEADQIDALMKREAAVREAFDGFRFRISRTQSAWTGLQQVARMAGRRKTLDQAMVCLATDNPAEAADDELANANRVAETLFTAHALPGIGVWLDTLADVDRGYFPRTGLVDRRFNPRMAGRVVKHLNSALGAGFDALPVALPERSLVSGSEQGRVLALRAGTRSATLLLPVRATTIVALPSLPSLPSLPFAPEASESGQAQWIDLVSGAITPVRWHAAGGDAAGATLEAPMPCSGPALLLSLPTGH